MHKSLKRSDGKPGQSNAYNWVCRSVQSQGPIIVLYLRAHYHEVELVLERFNYGL